jgi:hypothetical protein
MIFYSCKTSKGGHSKKGAVAKKATDTVVYVPFTKELRDRVLYNNLDIKKLQFFIDQKLILRRTLGAVKADIQSGILLFEKGQYIQEIIIPAYTPAVCEGINGDRMTVSFESAASSGLEFGALWENNYFKLLTKKTVTGGAEVSYNHNTYSVQCGTCALAGETRLVVIKKEIDNMKNTQRIVEGRKVGS